MLNMVVPFDKAMPAFHSLIGHMLVASAVVHVAGHSVNYGARNFAKAIPRRGFHGYGQLLITGIALTLVLAAMRTTVMPRIRRRKFELFYYTHVAGFVLYYAFIIMHGAHRGELSTWKYVALPLLVYFADRGSRFAKENVARLEVTQSTASVQGDVVCLRLPRTFHYVAGQYADIKVPQVSTVEWHPFTIASSPHESDMLFFIKKNGDWTEKLHAMFSNPGIDSDEALCQVHVRGPFGAPAQHTGQYEHVVLIGGGVGATPFCSIAKNVHNVILQHTERGFAVNKGDKFVSAAFARTVTAHQNGFVVGTPEVDLYSTAADGEGAARSLDASGASGPRDMGARSASGAPGSGRNFIRSVSSRLGSESANNLARSHSRRGRQRRTPQPGVYFDGPVPTHSDAGGLHLSLPPEAVGAHAFLTESAGTMGSAAGGEYPDDLGDPDAPLTSRRSRGFDPPSSAGQHSDDLGDPNAPLMSRRSRGGDLYSSAGQYSDDLGDPDAPLTSRRSQGHDLYSSAGQYSSPPTSPPALGGDRSYKGSYSGPESGGGGRGRLRRGLGGRAEHQSGRRPVEVVREYDSSRSLFTSSDASDDEEFDEDDEFNDDDDVVDASRVNSSRVGQRPHVQIAVGADFADDTENMLGTQVDESMEFENMLLRDAPLESNAAELIGLSFGSTAMVRHMMRKEQGGMTPAIRRASMHVNDDMFESAPWEERALFYLHTVTVNWVLLWIMLARYCGAAIAGITNGFLLGQKGLAVFATKPLIIANLVVALVLAFPVNFAVALELKLHGLLAFLADSYGNMFDILLLVPLSAACCVLSLLGLLGIGSEVEHVSKVTLLLFWPTMSLLLLWRLGRTIGSRISLAQYMKSTAAQTKSMDFIWVSKTHGEDEWLVREMLPLVEAKIVRLHRYITREDSSVVEPWTLDYAEIPLRTQHKRPHWDEVFAGLAARSKSGSVIGVFYCGPPSMARAIEQGAMKAMAKSTQKAYQQGYMQALSDTNDRNAVRARDGCAYGCAVRFALREENFVSRDRGHNRQAIRASTVDACLLTLVALIFLVPCPCLYILLGINYILCLRGPALETEKKGASRRRRCTYKMRRASNLTPPFTKHDKIAQSTKILHRRPPTSHNHYAGTSPGKRSSTVTMLPSSTPDSPRPLTTKSAPSKSCVAVYGVCVMTTRMPAACAASKPMRLSSTTTQSAAATPNRSRAVL
jgi:hypothetical protein